MIIKLLTVIGIFRAEDMLRDLVRYLELRLARGFSRRYTALLILLTKRVPGPLVT